MIFLWPLSAQLALFSMGTNCLLVSFFDSGMLKPGRIINLFAVKWYGESEFWLSRYDSECADLKAKY